MDIDGTLHTTLLNSSGKIIVCAGAIYTPYLLLKSGYTMPDIGRGLKTHYGFSMIVAVDEPFTFSSGPIAFLSATGTTNTRDWQIIVSGSASPALVKLGSVTNNTNTTTLFTFILWNLKPKVSGSVTVGTSNSPNITLGLFGDEEDNTTLVAGMRYLSRLLIELKKTYSSIRTVYPPQVVIDRNNPTELLGYIKHGLSLTDHYSCTCAMGTVVDSTFKLYGSNTIYCVDASVFPTISDGNTNYPVMVMAEVAADRIGNIL